jgi:hypothetical protein
LFGDRAGGDEMVEKKSNAALREPLLRRIVPAGLAEIMKRVACVEIPDQQSRNLDWLVADGGAPRNDIFTRTGVEKMLRQSSA